MRTVVILADVPGATPDEAFDRLTEFERYGELVDLVRYVEVDRVTPTRIDTEWSVLFRKGVLTWSETDVLDRDNMRITFTQTDGDFEEMSGDYRIEATDEGSRILLTNTFDFGVASIESIVEPVAERVLRESFERIFEGLFGDTVSVHAPDEGRPPAPAAAPILDYATPGEGAR